MNKNQQKQKHRNSFWWLLMLVLTTALAGQSATAQTVAWTAGPPTVSQSLVAMTDTETADIAIIFDVRIAALTTPRVQVTLPAGVAYVAGSIAAGAGNQAGAPTATVSGQVVTVAFPAAIAAETRASITLKVTSTVNAAGCAFEDGNVDVKVLSNTTLVATGGQAAALPVSAVKPAFTITPKSAGPTGGTQTNGAAVVAGLATPSVDKGTFSINIATTQRTAKGLRLTLTVDANTTLDNFAFEGTAVTATKSGNVYTINFPAEVFSTTAKVLSFDGISKYSGAHAITIGYQYNPTVNCVNGSITGVYSLNYVPVVGKPFFAMPSVQAVLPPTSGALADFASQPNLTHYELPMDGATTWYRKFIYRNTGSATAQEISTGFSTYYSANSIYSYINKNKDILYSINNSVPKPVDRVVLGAKMADNVLRRLKPGISDEYYSVTVYIDNDVVPVGQELVFYFPVIAGDIYDNSVAKFSTYQNVVNDFMISTTSSNSNFTSKNGNGETGDKISTSTSNSIQGVRMRFEETPAPKLLHPGDATTDVMNFRNGTVSMDGTLYRTQTTDINVKIPPFIELLDAVGNVTTDITQALTWGTQTPLSSSSANAGVYKVYTVNYGTGSEATNPLTLRYRAIEATNPISAGYSQNTTDSIEYWADWKLGALTATAASTRPTLQRLAQLYVPVTFAVEEEGLRILSFDFQRTRKGLKDSNNNRIADDGSIAPDNEIEHNRYWAYDTGNMIVKGVIKAGGGNTMFNNLYITLNSEIALSGGTNITMKTAELLIKRGSGSMTKNLAFTTTATAGKRYLFFENVALIAGDSITLTMPFETGSAYSNALRTISVEGYVDAESTLRPADPYNPDATVGYTKFGKDATSYSFGIYWNTPNYYHGQSHSVANNNIFQGTAIGLRFSPDTYNQFKNEVNYSMYPQLVTLVLPDGYVLGGGTYGENLGVSWTSGSHSGQIKQVPPLSQQINANGLVEYTYDWSTLFDPAITEANPGDGSKWGLPDDYSFMYGYVSIRATKGAQSSSSLTGTLTAKAMLQPGQPLWTANINTPMVYTGTSITLSVPTTTINATSKTVTVPTLTAGNPNAANYKMWLYVKGNIANLKAQKLGTMDFPINGQGTDGKWIPLGTVNAQTGVDYSLTYDITNINNCVGDTVIVYTVYDNGDATFNPMTAAFNPNDIDHNGQLRRIIVKPAPATILSSLSVAPATLVYNNPYTLTVNVDASSSQGVLKNDTVTLTIPSGQEYVPGSAKIAFGGTQAAVSAATEALLVAHNADIISETVVKLSTAQALNDPAFAFDGIASGVDASRQKAVYTMQFKPMCDTRLTGIRFVAVPAGENFCGQAAAGSGRNFRSEVMISTVTSGYDFTVVPVTASGNRVFNETNKTETLKVTATRASGRTIVQAATDSLVITMPSALNISGSISAVSSGLGINTTIGAAAVRNTVSGSVRTIGVALPVAQINADAVDHGYQKPIEYTMTLEYTPAGQAFAVNPEHTIDAIVQTNVKFSPVCPDAPAAVGNGSLGVALLTAFANPSFACLNMGDTLAITSDGFQGKWYREKSRTTELPSIENGVKFVYKPTVQQDTAFYVSAIINGTDYGVAPVQVKMNPELKPGFTAGNVCFGLNTVFTNTTTLGGAAAPGTVTYEWYVWENNAKTPFDGAGFTAKSPTRAFGAGKHRVFLLATSPSGCFASSDTIEFEVYELPVPTITGKTPACYLSSEIYTTESGMSNYTWEMSKSNGTDFDGDLSPSSTENATVNWDKANVVGIISVNYTDLNGCRAATPTGLNVIVRNLPVTPVLNSGPTEVCANAEEMYIVRKITGIKEYTWSLSSLGAINGATNAQTASIIWGNTPGNAIININQINNDGCEAEIPLTVAVKVKGSGTPVINGSADVCAAGTYLYETGSGMTNYQWTVNGGTYTSVAGSPNQINVTWDAAGTGSISVSYTDDGCPTNNTATPKQVTIKARPVLSWASAPKTTVCAGEVVTYAAPAGKTNYVWTVTGQTSYTGGSTGDNTITVTWADVASGQVSVNYEDGGCSAVEPLKANIGISKVTMQPTTGAGTLCVGSVLSLTNPTVGAQTWRSANAAVATVSNDGTVSGVSKGNAIIWCIVSNAAGCKDSISATVTVQNRTEITAQPIAASIICSGETANLSVSATGEAPLSYQWKKNGLNITGAVSATYTAFEAGTYSVDVTGACGIAVPSDNAVVTLKAETKISMQPQGGAICAGTSLPLSVSATGEGTLTYEWLCNGVAAAGINNQPTYSASAAGNYSVRVTGGCGSPVLSETAVLTIKAATQIIEQPVGGALCPGNNLRLSIEATGEGVLSYQWKHDGNPIAGAANANYTISNAQLADAGSYTVEVTDACGATVSSTAAAVTVEELELTLSVTQAAICLGGTYDLSSAVGTVTGGARLSYIVNGVETGNPFVQPTAAGAYAYDLVLHSAHCASQPQTFTLIVEDLPRALLLGGDVCVGGDVQFTAHTTPSDGTGVWYSSNSSVATVDMSTGAVSGVSAGVFEVIYRHTGGSGCMSETTSSTFNVYPLPTVSVKDMTVCSGSIVHTADLVSSIHNGDKYAIYDAAVGGNLLGASLTATATATYYVEGIMTGVNCLSAGRVPVTVTVLSEPVFTLTANPVDVCNGGHINVKELVDGVNISNYSVEVYRGDGSPVTGTIITPVNSTEVYSVRIVSNDVNTCASAYQSLRVNLGSVQHVSLDDGANDYGFCAGETVTLTPDPVAATAINVEWRSSNPAVASVDNAGNVTTVSEGQALISYSHTEDGCHYEGSRAILVNALPQLTHISHFSACEGETVLFSQLASAGSGSKLNFYLSGNASAETADRVPVGTADLVYTVEAEDMSTGCVNAQHTVTINANSKPTFDVPSVPAEICQGESLDLASLVSNISASDHNLTVEDAAGNVLSGSVVSPQARTTTYRVRVVDNAGGCTSVQQTVTVTVKDKPVLAVDDLTACEGSTVDLNTAVTSGAGALTFYRDAQGVTLVGNPSAVTVQAGTAMYYVRVEENGCLSELHPIAVIGESMPVFELTGGKFTVCEGEQMVAYTAPAGFFNYSWTVAGGTVASRTDNKVFVDWDAAGYGNIAVSYATSSGCGSALTPRSYAVVIQASPDASFTVHDATGSTVAAVCAGNELMLSPLTAGGTWSVTPSALASVSGNALTALSTITGVQTIEVAYSLTGGNGCTMNSVNTLTINPLPVSSDVTFDVTLPDGTVVSSGASGTVCRGSTVSVNTGYSRSSDWGIVYVANGLERFITSGGMQGTDAIMTDTRFEVLQITDFATGCVNSNAASLASLGLDIILKPDVSITEHPQSQHFCRDSHDILLRVAAAGAIDSIRWFLADGTKLDGETAATLLLDASADISGEYYAEVYGCNTVRSTTASVTKQLEVIEQKRNHTLWVNNNPDSNGGYSFAHYVWMKDGVQLQEGIHDDNMGVHYIDGSDLTLNASYQVLLTTVDGKRFLSCPYYYLPQSFGASVRAYPNPVAKSAVKTVFVDVEIDDASVLADAVISVYSSDGKFIGTVRCEGRRITPVEMPSATGVYVLKFISSEIEKEIKIIVE